MDELSQVDGVSLKALLSNLSDPWPELCSPATTPKILHRPFKGMAVCTS
jgi:hypothetical protein